MFFKKIFLAVFSFLFFLAGLQAQRASNNYNYLDFNQKPYYFGITLGYNSSDFKVFRSKNFITNDEIHITEGVTGPGFNLGVVSNLRVGEYFDIRFLPTLSFSERNIEYKKTNDSNSNREKFEQVLVELPFHVRYKSAPYNDKRMFLIAGCKYVYDVASTSTVRQSATLVKIAPTDFCFEIGTGIQMYFPYFIFSPEIKFSRGLSNVLLYNNNVVKSQVLEKVLSRGLTVSLHFEG
ncbi:MAG: hypothetical protein RLZZ292_727 [Bacteroidota bacterium]|jgi:opacity protein-like surface antigen